MARSVSLHGGTGTSGEVYWREQIAACEASGMSIAAYCEAHGLRASRYYWWKSELRRRGVAGGGFPRFAEVVVTSDGPAPSADIEITLVGDRVVRVRPGFDGATLAAVVRVLEGLGEPEAHKCSGGA